MTTWDIPAKLHTDYKTYSARQIIKSIYKFGPLSKILLGLWSSVFLIGKLPIVANKLWVFHSKPVGSEDRQMISLI